jgi:hypothetical protein
MVLNGGGFLKTRREMRRYALARRIHHIALRVSAGKPVRIRGKSVCVPDRVSVEEEFESAAGKADLEFDIHWPLRVIRPSARNSTRVSPRRRATRSLP